ncbi:hypothetical protein PPYR_02810 [Photinus pyralis]|uniref:C2H2-type domain-containing protein n=1 Tax=Photinus pyralis TaxID=7054 RepID=A0A1Y1MR84_PHOPY|nr:zinc finger protein 513-like [Photinus pyralis]KAB0791010.1 hypothetical protein PPYR_02810 [Photinus pyralis]
MANKRRKTQKLEDGDSKPIIDYKIHLAAAVHLPKLNIQKNEDVSFKCKECEYVTKLKGNLKVHAVVHSGERNFPCEYCPYKATQSSSLKTHVRLKHGKPRKLKCELCKYTTALRGNLKKHAVVHTGEKNFKSPLCDFRAGQSSTVTTHIRLCHRQDAKMFQCEHCQYETPHKGNLKKHNAIHY